MSSETRSANDRPLAHAAPGRWGLWAGGVMRELGSGSPQEGSSHLASGCQRSSPPWGTAVCWQTPATPAPHTHGIGHSVLRRVWHARAASPRPTQCGSQVLTSLMYFHRNPSCSSPHGRGSAAATSPWLRSPAAAGRRILRDGAREERAGLHAGPGARALRDHRCAARDAAARRRRPHPAGESVRGAALRPLSQSTRRAILVARAEAGEGARWSRDGVGGTAASRLHRAARARPLGPRLRRPADADARDSHHK